MNNTNLHVYDTGSTPFRARARLIRLLGEELISDEVMAVVELVKNGYDADAHQVTVSLKQEHAVDRGEIRVYDNGMGMDLEQVLNVWMEPATPNKRAGGRRKARTPLGRIQLGEKGVGRFAADKLGSELELISRKAGNPEEVGLRVSWHRYDQDHYLDEVENRWFTRKPVVFNGDRSGTVAIVRSLRTAWSEDMVRRLHNGLTRLVAPSQHLADFEILFECDMMPSLNGRLWNRIVESAPYRLSGSVDETGTLRVSDGSSEDIDLRTLSGGHFADGHGGMRAPSCGPFRIELNVWDLEPLKINGSGFGVDMETRRQIKSASGVSIYRDGFRVWPYGEPDDDWLELNQRRVNNPTMRISNNQVIGLIEITHHGNPELRDRTSREGLIDNSALYDLKALVLAAILTLETSRFAIRRDILRMRDSARLKQDDPILHELSLARAAMNGTGNGGIKSLREIERLYKEQKADADRRYEHVSQLAGIGMAAELLTDGFSRRNLRAMTQLRALLNEIRTKDSPELKRLAEELFEQMEEISEQVDLMNPLYQPDAQVREAINVAAAIYDSVFLLKDNLAENDTEVRLTGDRALAVRFNRGHLMQVMMILLNNAQNMIAESGMSERLIEVSIFSDPHAAGLRICDSGPGVMSGARRLIFEPHYSTRKAGRGLGLHVARDILSTYNSQLVLEDGNVTLPGACFRITFDRRRLIN